MVIFLEDESALHDWGIKVGKQLGAQDLVFLKGPLGAGKTTLVRAMAKGYGVVPEQVTSPTFNLHHQMETQEGLSVHHIDGYRVRDPREYEQIGLDFLEAGLTFVEWPDLYHLASPTLSLTLKISGEGREIDLESSVNLKDFHA